MNPYADLLSRFQAGVLRGASGRVRTDIAEHPTLIPDRQFAIYAEGYRLRLAGALRADYPALAAHLGDAVFDAMAQAYIEQTPSRSYNLDRYGFGFGGFVAAAMPGFAGDLARLESAIAQVFLGRASDPLDPAALAGLDGAAVAALVLRPRLASQVLDFSVPVEGWLAAQRRGELPPPPPAAPQSLYIYRHDNQVRRVVLPPAGAVLLRALIAGRPLADALGAAAARDPDADLLALVPDWIATGFFRA